MSLRSRTAVFVPIACALSLAGCIPSAQYAEQACIERDGLDRVIKRSDHYVIICNDGTEIQS